MLASQHFVVERPADGIRPRFLEAILGRRAKEPIRKGDPITWEQL
jgi:sialic acid synthase SpsE